MDIKKGARGTAKFVNASFDSPKKSMKRYYLYLSPTVAESEEWPFQEGEILLAYIDADNERVIIEKF